MAGLWTNKNYDTSSRYVFGNADLSGLAAITNQNIKQLESIKYGFDPQKCSQLLGQSIPNDLIRLDYPRICSGCLTENNFIRAIWDIPALTVCPEHKQLLIDYCPECNSRTRWNRSGVNVCHQCQFDFRLYKFPKVSDVESLLSELLYNLCFGEKVIQNKLPKPIQTLNFKELLELISDIVNWDYQNTASYLQTKKSLSFKTANNHLLHKHYCNAMSHLSNWPNNFYQFLTDCREIRRNNGVRNGISKEIGTTFYRLQSKQKSKPYKLLWQAYCVYSEQEKRRVKIALADNKKNSGIIFITKAAKELNMLSESLLWYCKHLKIKVNKDAKNRFILQSDLAAIKNFLKQVVNFVETQQQLGVSRTQLESLIKQKIITPLRGPAIDNSRDWLFHQDVINEFQNNLVNLCVTKGKKQYSLSLLEAIEQICFYHFGLAELVSAIFNGKITPLLKTTPLKINKLRFDKTEILKLRNRTEHSEQDWRPVQAQNFLGYKRHWLYGLFNSGQLAYEKKQCFGATRPIYVCQRSDVMKFKNKYVLGFELCNKHKINSLKLFIKLSSQGIYPVSGPSIDNGYCYLFLRKEVSHLLQV